VLGNDDAGFLLGTFFSVALPQELPQYTPFPLSQLWYHRGGDAQLSRFPISALLIILVRIHLFPTHPDNSSAVHLVDHWSLCSASKVFDFPLLWLCRATIPKTKAGSQKLQPQIQGEAVGSHPQMVCVAVTLHSSAVAIFPAKCCWGHSVRSPRSPCSLEMCQGNEKPRLVFRDRCRDPADTQRSPALGMLPSVSSCPLEWLIDVLHSAGQLREAGEGGKVFS
jgi:hypothetical protein